MASTDNGKKATLKRCRQEIHDEKIRKDSRKNAIGIQGERFANGQVHSLVNEDSLVDEDSYGQFCIVVPLHETLVLSKTHSQVDVTNARRNTGNKSVAQFYGPKNGASQTGYLRCMSAPAFKIVDSSEPGKEAKSTNPEIQQQKIKPDDFLSKRLGQDGLNVKTIPYSKTTDFFVPLTEEVVMGFDMDLIKKVREEDIDGLRELMISGRTMQCSNKFGDSVVHMACRRGSLSVLKFLLHEASVLCQVCCDGGRTPLHDACWTSSPNFDIVQLLLEQCPDLLYITDKRGFTPLSYARQSHWGLWCDFLETCPLDLLLPKQLWVLMETQDGLV